MDSGGETTSTDSSSSAVSGGKLVPSIKCCLIFIFLEQMQLVPWNKFKLELLFSLNHYKITLIPYQILDCMCLQKIYKKERY